MAFNHYAKLRLLLEREPEGWVIRRIDQPTRAKNFRGEIVGFDHYYRLYDRSGEPIKYGKFQQIDLLARALQVPVEELPVITG